MDTSRNKFTNIICIIFSVVLALLFCYAAGIRFGIENMVSRAIIAAVYCGVVVGLAFVLNRIVKMIMNKDFYIDDDKVYIGTVIADSILFIAFRLLVISDVIKVEFMTSSVYEMAKIGEDGKMFVSFSSLDSIFATFLSALFKLFGNTFFPVYFIQFIFSILAFVLLMYSINKIMGRFASGVVGLGLAVLPVFYEAIARDSADCFVVFLFSFVLFLSAKYKNSIENDRIKIWFSLIIGIVCGLLSLYSSVFLFGVAIPIIVLWDCRNEYTKDRAINTFVIMTGYILTIIIALLVDCYLISGTGVTGFAEAITYFISSRFKFSLNTILIKGIVSESNIYLLMVLSIVYCVMFWKNEDDTAHIPAVLWMLLLLEIIGVNITNPSAAAMVFALLLLMISATGIYDLGYTESLTRLYRIADDMEPAVITSIEDKQTNIQINLPVENTSIPVVSEAEFNQMKEDIAAEQSKADEVVEIKADIDDVQSDTNTVTDVIEQSNTVVVGQSDTAAYFDYLTAPLDNSQMTDPVEAVADKVEEVDIDNIQEKITESAISDSSESKYCKAETRKETNYGINDVDFESLFSNTNVPPKSVYKDIYLDENDDSNEELDENIIETKTDLTEQETVNEGSLASFEEKVDAEDSEMNETSNESAVDDLPEGENVSKDKKAYVDSFFGYLYDGQDEAKEEQPVKEEYVSHADKFADLDLDLGFDAFDNVNQALESTNNDSINLNNDEDAAEQPIEEIVEQKPVNTFGDDSWFMDFAKEDKDVRSDVSNTVEEPVIEETLFGGPKELDETGFHVSTKTDNLDTGDGYEEVVKQTYSDWYFDAPDDIPSKSASIDEFEIDEVKEVKNLTNYEEEFVFDFSDVPKTVGGTSWAPIEDEVPNKDNVEDEVFKALTDFKPDTVETVETEETESIEEMLEKKIDESFSYEDALNVKLDNEEVDKQIGFSFEEALEKKIQVEAAISDAIEKENFSLEEALNDKIIAEDSLAEATQNEFESIENAVSGKINIEEIIDNNTDSNAFSFQEAIETKLDVERILEDATNDKMLEEFGDEKLFENIDMSFSGDIVDSSTKEMPVESVKENDGSVDDIFFDEQSSVEEIESLDNVDNIDITVESETVDLIDVEETKADNILDQVSDSEEKIDFIENPLPLPKKHVPREMDYGRVIPTAWMHYDIEVDKSNNFYDI